MTGITRQELGEILAPLIARVIALENRLDTEANQEDNQVVVVNNLGEISNPFVGQVAIDLSGPNIYAFTAALGWFLIA